MSAVSFAYAFSNISIKEKKRAVQKPQPKRVEPQEEEEQCPAPYDVNTTTAEMIKREVCFQISTDLMATLPYERWGDHGRGKLAPDSVVSAMVLDARGWRSSWVILFNAAGMAVVLAALEGWDRWRSGMGKEKADKEKTENDMV